MRTHDELPTHFDLLDDQQLDDIRARHLRAEHQAEVESEFAASNAHHDRGILLEHLERLAGQLAEARCTRRAA
jgi:hypothetical protein